MENLNEQEMINCNGGDAGSKAGAKLFGRAVGIALGGPIAVAYYAGCDMGWW
ncbi:hypothetical protein CLV99_3625 [Sphingobacterium yanglingense]|uniref:Uncharacterized protein n=1 Tax=Sphingobacterium yanglingense TaxID=1437280 RepID=A0A4V3DDD9_9SPHI|nr:hypothetical protein CLV99_3625 [Sphingobacterium yanglingense]